MAVVFDGWFVDKHISTGSEATVYSVIVHDPAEGIRTVACKSYTPNTYNEGRIQRELRIWQRLDHPNICPMLYIAENVPISWVIPGPHIIMPLCHTDLFEATGAHHSALGAASIATVFHDVLCALQYMHGLGIAHFDVKGENIGLFYDLDNDDIVERAVLLDFGSADDTLPVSDKSCRGTVEHLPPEDVMDTAADIYALGLTMREALQWSPEQPEWLRTLVDTRMVVADPAQRATATDLLAAIPV